MPVIEMTENVEQFLGGRLSPKSNPKTQASVWAVKEGDRGSAIGFPSQRDMTNPQPFGSGSNKAVMGFAPLKLPYAGSGKGEQEHIVNFNGIQLVEMVVDRESADARDRWCGQVSKGIVEGKKIAEIERMERLGVTTNPSEMQETIIKDDPSQHPNS